MSSQGPKLKPTERHPLTSVALDHGLNALSFIDRRQTITDEQTNLPGKNLSSRSPAQMNGACLTAAGASES